MTIPRSTASYHGEAALEPKALVDPGQEPQRNSMLLLSLTLLCFQGPESTAPEPDPKWGHSRHGAAYDEGPRQKPWRMEGIGQVHFPVTSAIPEVQEWFDQGMALLHGFWFFEAERSFRWCTKLDPECAMAYWGMARSVGFEGPGGTRARDFLAEASARKHQVSDRERAYIELQEAILAAGSASAEEKDELSRIARVHMDTLLMAHPDDIEARALYVLDGMTVAEEESTHRYAMESVLQEVLRDDPDHVGALHYRVHNWDGKEGRYAIESCVRLTETAPNCGHLQHMPGHVLSSIGMWHEAAIAMDAATRVEKAYMLRRRILPKDNWNYLHNLDYLSYIQEQLGMFDAALLGAAQMRLGPGSPESDGFFAMMSMKTKSEAQVRALLKDERWQAVLDLATVGEEAPPPLKTMMARARGRALIELGRLEEAEAALKAIDELSAGPAGPGPIGPGSPAKIKAMMERMKKQHRLELQGLLHLARGESMKAIAELTEAAELQEKDWTNDPPTEAHFGFNTLGEAFLKLGSPTLAAQAFERTLETVFHDGFALAGLVKAYHSLGRADDAAEAMAALEVVWADADSGNRRLDEARATGVQPAKGELSDLFRQRMDQRNYRAAVYDKLGPSLYRSPPAPELLAVDHESKNRTLAEHTGRNVLLIFFLGEKCLHCVEQLQVANERFQAFQDLNTDIVAVSKDDVATLADAKGSYSLTLLSDPDFRNARRFHSYDDFEDAELHSTFLIDSRGNIHWSEIGGAPFMDFDFLEREAKRLNEGGEVERLQDVAGAR